MNYLKMKELREAHGMTQQELGTMVYVTSQMINQIEHGVKKPSLDLLERLADALGVSKVDLI